MGSRICPSWQCSSFRTWGDRSLRMDIICQIGGPGQLQDVNIGVVEDSINKAATVRAPPKCLVVLERLLLTHLQCQSEGLDLLTRGIALVQSKIKEYVKTVSSFWPKNPIQAFTDPVRNSVVDLAVNSACCHLFIGALSCCPGSQMSDILGHKHKHKHSTMFTYSGCCCCSRHRRERFQWEPRWRDVSTERWLAPSRPMCLVVLRRSPGTFIVMVKGSIRICNEWSILNCYKYFGTAEDAGRPFWPILSKP